MVAAKARNIMEVHRMLAHLSKETSRQTAEVVVIATTGQRGSCKACLQAKTKRHAVPKMADLRASEKGYDSSSTLVGQ